MTVQPCNVSSCVVLSPRGSSRIISLSTRNLVLKYSARRRGESWLRDRYERTWILVRFFPPAIRYASKQDDKRYICILFRQKIMLFCRVNRRSTGGPAFLCSFDKMNRPFSFVRCTFHLREGAGPENSGTRECTIISFKYFLQWFVLPRLHGAFQWK